METEKVIFDNDEHSITVKPVTLIFNNTYGESVYPERVMIDSNMTLDHFKTLQEIDPYTAAFFKFVVDDYPHPVMKSFLEKSAIGCRHLIGLFSLSLELLSQQKKFGWKYPEANLHPRQQLNLADALIVFGQPERFVKLVKYVQAGFFDQYQMCAKESWRDEAFRVMS